MRLLALIAFGCQLTLGGFCTMQAAHATDAHMAGESHDATHAHMSPVSSDCEHCGQGEEPASHTFPCSDGSCFLPAISAGDTIATAGTGGAATAPAPALLSVLPPAARVLRPTSHAPPPSPSGILTVVLRF